MYRNLGLGIGASHQKTREAYKERHPIKHTMLEQVVQLYNRGYFVVIKILCTSIISAFVFEFQLSSIAWTDWILRECAEQHTYDLIESRLSSQCPKWERLLDA